MANRLLTGVSFFFIYLLWLIPFRVLYILSDFVAFILYHAGYRKDVVVDNLTKCFPEMSKKEIKHITKLFYKNLADVLVEGIKSFTMSSEQVKKRHKTINPEICERFFTEGKSLIGAPCHYGNWEWGSMSAGLYLQQPIIAFYKPLSNIYMDKYLKNSRSRYGTELVSIRETTKSFEINSPKSSGFIMAADQSPSNARSAIWVDFLGRKTAFLHGPEKHARANNIPIFFVDIQRVKRGYYELELSLISEFHEKLAEGEITKIYAKKLEEAIIKKPENWLWSHRRWKLKEAV
ncbi:MAG TPA: lysophospholipid acyltransferase family protein [Bacteroidales bacterium]